MIYLAADHRGFQLKEKIKGWLKEWNYEYEDMGAFVYDENDDYPDFVSKAAEKVSQDPDNSKAIILGGSGQGEAMVANRYKGVRAAVYYGGPEEIVALSREHNDSNVLSLGIALGSTIQKTKLIDAETVERVVRLWLDSPFSGEERHKRRISKF